MQVEAQVMVLDSRRQQGHNTVDEKKNSLAQSPARPTRRPKRGVLQATLRTRAAE
jgi:hypothetical protein